MRLQYEERLLAARTLQEGLEQRHRADLEAKDRQLAETWQWHREQNERLQQEKESRAAKYADDLTMHMAAAWIINATNRRNWLNLRGVLG